MKKIVVFSLFLLWANSILAQAEPKMGFRVHSHNDYLQNIPFWKAFSAGATSIEADVFLKEGALYVAHAQEEIHIDRKLENLYLEPIQKSIRLGLGSDQPLQLLIDIKSEPYATLTAIVKSLERYPDIISSNTISIVISGNRPKPSEYIDYPSYIFFDYQSLEAITNPSILAKIALVSLSFQGFSQWNGKGRLTAEDLEKVSSTIKKAKSLGKPFRFWATPDSKSSWKAFVDVGVDFINTDMPFECSGYLSTLGFRTYANTVFSEVYKPSFESDQKDETVKNIILMIGDGNGLTQISATALANNGELSLTQLKSIGFLKTQSADDFTTDSAGAGTALATGKKVPNRAIGTTIDGSRLDNITELLSKKGFVSGIVTTDEISGATPSAFYAHQKDRSMSQEIMDDLSKSTLSLFISKGTSGNLTENKIGDFTMVPSLDQVGKSTNSKIGSFMPGDPAADTSKNELSSATENALQFLKQKNSPFFLLVEGAKIDSYGHENDISGVIKEGIGFDKAITQALKFADSNKNTLVIVTADHETGGLTIPQGNLRENKIEGDFTTHDHTGTMIPVFAYGPKSNQFQGVYENNFLFDKMLKVLNIAIEKE